MVASHTSSRDHVGCYIWWSLTQLVGSYRMLYMVASHTTSRSHIGCYIWWPLTQIAGSILEAIYGDLSHN